MHCVTNNIEPYCQFKYVGDFGFSENFSLPKQRKKEFFEDYHQEFYVEEYYNFETLIERINNIYDEIIQAYKEKGVDKYSDECSFPKFIIANKYGEYLPVGVSAYGWNISIFFPYYLDKYFENKYGKEYSKSKFSQLTEQNEVFFYLDYKSEPYIPRAYQLVSDETAHIILKEFLDTGKTERELDPDIFYREILKRY